MDKKIDEFDLCAMEGTKDLSITMTGNQWISIALILLATISSNPLEILKQLEPGDLIDFRRDVEIFLEKIRSYVDDTYSAITTPSDSSSISVNDIHTCHANCPCHTGGKPLSDFGGGY